MERPLPVEICPILLPVALEQTYDYLVPDDLGLSPGDFVEVPFGPRQSIGVVWHKSLLPASPKNSKNKKKPFDPSKMKQIISRLDCPPLPIISMQFAEWVANYTLASPGMVLRMMMSVPKVFTPEKPRFGVQYTGQKPARLTPERQKFFNVLEQNNDLASRTPQIWTKGGLSAKAGVNIGVINGLVKTGSLVQMQLPAATFPQPRPEHMRPEFSDSQAIAARQLEAIGQAPDFNTVLLDGVTGSGKTEVYFEALAGALSRGAQVLVLLPEISLTNQFLDRFEARFGCRACEWHSSLSDGERARIWRGVASGAVKAVIGARSALFLPFSNLGLIIVDEEHDSGYKQEERVYYQARDMAVVRGFLGKCGVVLASATPSLESLVNAQNGRYSHIPLYQRYKGKALPSLTAIDMKTEPPEFGKWLSPPLVGEMEQTLANGEQVLLYLNRRGYAPLTLCRGCGHRFQCPQCASWLVEHKVRRDLMCHHCGFRIPPPKRCPKCEKEETLVPCGPGIERIAEEVRERFPASNLAILSSDLIPNIKVLREVMATIISGEVDIIIGTQIVAKGHNFPQLALVGVVDGDLGLQGAGDPRASERVFQMLHQVTGRAGRMKTKGRGLVQTYLPDHPVMQAILSGDREGFVGREIQARQLLSYPPYGRLVSVIVSARERQIAELYARDVARLAPQATKIKVLGPAPAPIAVIRGRYRFRLLAKAPRELDMQAYMRAWLAVLPATKGDLKLVVDIDPYNFM